MATTQDITLRLTIDDPVTGVAYALQNRKSEPVGQVIADGRAISFDVPVRVAGARFLGPYVRSEGPTRRFVYIAIGAQAGDGSSPYSRPAKIDIHDLPPDLLDRTRAGAVLEAHLPGRDKQGGPACATLRPLGAWCVADA